MDIQALQTNNIVLSKVDIQALHTNNIVLSIVDILALQTENQEDADFVHSQ